MRITHARLTRGSTVSICCFAALLIATPALAVDNNNPIPTPIVKSGVSAELIDFVTIPPSSAFQPRARINHLTHAGDGSGRLFITDSRGRIWVHKDGALLPNPFVDLNNLGGGAFVGNGFQQGARSVAFHPDFSTPGAAGEGKVYVAAALTQSSGAADFGLPAGAIARGVTTPTHHDAIIEWTVNPSNPDEVNFGSGRIVMRIAQPLNDHNMDVIAFNPNAGPGDADYGNLYIAVGDGGNTTFNFGGQVSAFTTGQDLQTPLGKILRIDPLPDGMGAQYTVPGDNPFTTDVNVLDEIWAYGLRNPQRFSWDTPVSEGGTGHMFITDIGQAKIEEVNVGLAGQNYGWREREGTFDTNPFNENQLFDLPANDASFGYTYPIAQYDHDEGNAITGAHLYRGSIPQLRGKYIFGDLVNGRVFYIEEADIALGSQAPIHELTLTVNGVERTLQQLVGNSRADVRFGFDEAGELYILTKTDGKVRMFEPRLPGDADGDGDVDLDDFNALAASFGASPNATFDQGDFDFDGDVDLDDFNLLASNFGATQESVDALPEPGVMAMLGLASAALFRRKVR